MCNRIQLNQMHVGFVVIGESHIQQIWFVEWMNLLLISTKYWMNLKKLKVEVFLVLLCHVLVYSTIHVLCLILFYICENFS